MSVRRRCRPVGAAAAAREAFPPKGGQQRAGGLSSPPSDTPEALWGRILEEARQLLKPKVFDEWVRPVRPTGLRDGCLRLRVPTPHHRQILEDRLAETLRQAAARAGLEDLRFEFVVPDKGPAAEDPEEGLRRLLREAGLSEAEIRDLTGRARRLIRRGHPPERVVEALEKPIRRLLARSGWPADPYAIARHALELVRAEPEAAPEAPDPAGAIAYVERNFQRHCPIGTLDKRRTGRREVLTFRFAHDDIEATWTVNPSVRYGLPGPFEVELWYALLIHAASLPKPIRNPIEVDLPVMRRLLNLSKQSKSNRRILEALDRLTTTHYASHLAFRWRRPDDETEFIREDKFVLIQRLETTETPSRRGSPTLQIRVWLNECILDNLNHRHVAPLDATFYSSLRQSVSRVLYVHLLPVLFAADGPEVRIPYRAVVTFAGLTEYRRPADIRKQLRLLLSELIRRGFILGFRLDDGSDGGPVVVLQKNPNFPYQVVRAP